MVRVAGLHDQVDAGIDVRKADGLSPSETIERIADRRRELGERHSRQWTDHVRPALAEEGIRILDGDDLSADESERLDRIFSEQIFPVLTPLAVGPGRPFPYISNLSLSLGVWVHDPGERHPPVRAGEGPARGAAAVRGPGRRRLRAPGGGHRAQPGHAVPGHGGPGPRGLPGDPRRRLRGLRRGRRPAARRRGRAARPPLRRGRAAGGGGGHRPRPARLPGRAAGHRGERVRGRARPAGPRRPVAAARPGRLRAPARGVVDAGERRPVRLPRRQGGRDGRHARVRPAGAPPLRLVRGQRRAAGGAGRARPPGAGHQDDRVPHLRTTRGWCRC